MQEVNILLLASRKDIYTQLLPCKEPAIFVVDDSTQNYLDIEFKDLMYKSNVYFIIISRKKLVYQREDSNGAHKEYLPLHDEIYTISTEFSDNDFKGYRNIFTKI